MVEKITDQELANLKEKNVLVDFYADWCGPCKMIAPLLAEISEEISEVKFVKLNVDENKENATKFNVMSIPTLILLENGEEKSRKIGFASKQDLIKWIKENI